MEEHDCNQKENIAKLFTFHEEKMKQLGQMEVRQVEIQGDIKHIKTRIDNGMSHTIHNLDQTLMKLVPVIDHHASIVKRIEGIGWTLATSLILALVAYLAWGISHGFKLPS
jgi:hypothetical protein